MKIKILIGLCMLWTSFSFAEVRQIDPSGPHCSKATGLSQGFAEYAAGKLKVSTSSIRLIRASKDYYNSCEVTVDTPKGPQTCVGASLYTDGRSYWIGGICF